MKVKELIEKLKELPENDEIFVLQVDDILGYFYYTDPEVDYTEAFKHDKGYEAPISNWTPKNYEVKKIWVIK